MLYDIFSYTGGRPPGVPHHRHLTKRQVHARRSRRSAERRARRRAHLLRRPGRRRPLRRHRWPAPPRSTARTSRAGSRSRDSSRSASASSGVKAHDLQTDEHFEMRAKQVVNATGVWTDDTQRMVGERGHVQGARVEGHPPRRAARPHPVGDGHDLPHREERAVRHPVGPALDHRHDRHRLEPRQGAPGGDRGRHRLPARARQRGARRAAHAARTSRACSRDCDRCSPGESDQTSKLSREHLVAHTVPGLVVIAGGKWTTYRIMAKDAIDAAADALDGKVPPSTTQDIPLLGAEGYQARMEQARQDRAGVRRAQGAHRAPAEPLRHAHRRAARPDPQRSRARRAAARRRRLSRGRGRLRGLARGRAAPRRRARAPHPHLDRGVGPRRLGGAGRGEAHGRGARVGRRRARPSRSSATCSAWPPSAPRRSSPTTSPPTACGSRRPTS